MLEFLQASDELQFEGRNREEVYGWVSQTLREQGIGNWTGQTGAWFTALWKR